MDNVMECWTCTDCWKYPEQAYKQKVKVRNKKYCWLYPEKNAHLLNKLVPDFSACKSLYTKCDFHLEKCAHEQIKKLENQIHGHYEMFELEMSHQNKLIHSMWKDSQRYLLLSSRGLCVKPYPEIVSKPTEQRALCDFHMKRKCLFLSIRRLDKSMEKINISLEELNRRCTLLDHTVESPFIVGDWYIRPLKSVREIIDDLYKFFYDVQCKLRRWAELVDPGDSGAIEDYMTLVQPSSRYDNLLMIGFEYCTCLRTNNRKCLKRHVPC